jgi:hypothetical protein
MEEAVQYPIATLMDIARIPEKAFPRFMEEFPLMVATVRAQMDVIVKIHEQAGVVPPTEEGWLKSMRAYRWIDDDKGNVSAGIAFQFEDGTEHKLVKMEGNHKTGKFSAEFDIPTGEQ